MFDVICAAGISTIVTIMNQSFETPASAIRGYPGQTRGFHLVFNSIGFPSVTGLRYSFARVLAVITVLL